MMKSTRTFVCARLLTAVTMLLGAVATQAQQMGYDEYKITPAEFSKTKGVDISSLGITSSTSAEKVYLYNVGTDRFFNAGGWWGTQAATYTVGLPVTIEQASSGSYYNNYTTTYYMTVAYENSGSGQGNYVGYASAHTGSGTPAGYFCDREKTTSGSTGSAAWTFTRVTDSKYGFADDEYVYTLSCNDNYMYDGDMLSITGLEYKTNNMVTPKSTDPTSQSSTDDALKGMWKIVTHKELIEDFENTYDHTIDPADATFLIRGQGFNRQSKFLNFNTSGTPTYNNGWYNSDSLTIEANADTCHFTTSGEHQSKDATYGMFYNCRIKEGNKNAELVQRIVAPRRGWYRLDCEGFYHRSDKSVQREDAMAVLFARVDSSGVKLATGNPNPEFPDYDENPTSQYAHTAIWAKELIAPKDTSLTTMKSVGEAFYYDYFPVHAYFYARHDTTTVDIGIRLLQDVKSGEDWVCFDDFQLKFLGDEVVLSEREASINHSNDNVDYKNRLLLLERKLSTTQWNTFTVPFDMTRDAVQTAFGYDSRVAEFKGLNEQNQLQFNAIKLNNIARTDTVLRKGECYLIKTTKPYKDETYYAYTYNQTSPVYYYYTIERTSFNKTKLQQEGGDEVHYNNEWFTRNDCKVTMGSSYVVTQAPVNSYVFSGGNLYYISKPTAVKGYRGWIVDEHQTGVSGAKRHQFGHIVLDGVEDDQTTYIDDCSYTIPEPALGQQVYDLNGRQVRTGTDSLEGLSKGIYIVEGKKYIVK